LASAVTRFEAAAADVAARRGGRVVKHIGDEVMFSAVDPVVACHLALDLVRFVSADPVLGEARAAVTLGEVVTQDGDLYGPVVNVAARATGEAEPGTLVVTDEVRHALQGAEHLEARPVGAHELRGIVAPVELFEVRGADP
jgi:adenylate cyclase